MTTQYGYSRNLAAVLFFALLVVLYGGCAKSTSTGHVAVGHVDSDVGQPGAEAIMSGGQDEAMRSYDEPATDEYEAGTFLGYRDPDYTDTVWTPTVSEEETTSSPGRDTEEGYSGMVTPASDGSEEEGTSALYEEPTADVQETGASVEDDPPSAEETSSTDIIKDEEYTRGRTEAMDNDRSDIVAPGMDSENPITPDANSDGVMSGGPDPLTVDDPNLVPNETPSDDASPSMDIDETNHDSTPGPPP